MLAIVINARIGRSHASGSVRSCAPSARPTATMKNRLVDRTVRAASGECVSIRRASTPRRISMTPTHTAKMPRAISHVCTVLW
jgi:hypothetical protein